MSIENIKDLFCKRVEESTTLIAVNDSSSSNSNENVLNKHKKESFVSLKETEVGISEYLSNCKGFDAVIKERFSDFHVHEVDSDGNIVYLTNMDIPVVTPPPLNEEILSEEIWEKLKSLRDKVIESVEIDVTDLSKEKRKDIHKTVKGKYGSAFDSNTIEIDNKKKMVITLGKDRRNEPWFSDLGKYLHFVLFKANLDTVEAINILASKLKTKASYFTYSGTKDKRAKTSQWVSMGHLDAKKLNGLNKSMRDIKVGNYIYKDTPLKLGDLKGNFFEIALRNVTENDEIVSTALNNLKENGFLNYFGLQRFGNCAEVPTYAIGKALAVGEFKNAVQLILSPKQKKSAPDLKEAKRIYSECGDAEKAVKCLKSKDRTIEGKLLMGLVKHGKNAFINALDCIPRNVRLLYLHSYQSLIWNQVLSKRIKQFGKVVIEGDLVYVKEENILPDSESSISSNKSVRHISREEINNFTIFDIIHPLPGYNVTYPNNILKEWYDELLYADELSSENLKQIVRQYSLSGSYRHIAKKVKDLSWNICNYSKPEEDLILSDLDKLNGASLQINENLDNKYKAVILRFSLDSSTYATMALREILKIDTSVSYQTGLNNYSQKRTSEECVNIPPKKSKV